MNKFIAVVERLESGPRVLLAFFAAIMLFAGGILVGKAIAQLI